MKHFSLLFSLLAIALSLNAQTGTIAGRVVEAASGFEVIGGSVLIEGTDRGAATDLDGNYSIGGLQPGVYTVEFSYIGFSSQRVTDVEVKAGETTTLDAALGETAVDVGVEIVVEAKALRNTESAVLTLQRNAPVVLDGISSAQISKAGDSDVAGAVRRVTGVTVEGGKYVYIRGLGDRYSKTSLNGLEIPGLDPNRNTVQMDLFPTNLIDNILVYKTFSPDLPGDFSGGLVDIVTRDFPSEFSLNASVSVGGNTLSTLNDSWLSYEGSSSDWLGYDDGLRAIPDAVANTPRQNFPAYSAGLSDAGAASNLSNLTRAFANNWQFQRGNAPVNHSFSISSGNNFSLGGSSALGLVAAVTYQRNFTGYNDGAVGIYELNSPAASTQLLNPQLELEETFGQDDVLWGAMLSGNLKINSNNKIGFMLMRNQSGTSSSRSLSGVKFRDDPDELFETRTWAYQERGLSTAQVNGKHVFADNAFTIEWKSSLSQSTQEDPDLRFFTNRYDAFTDNFRIKPSSDREPTRFYRDLSQVNVDNKLDLTYKFRMLGEGASVKGGLAYVTKDREFREVTYSFRNQNNNIYDGDPYAYFFEENLISPSETSGTFQSGVPGIYVIDNYIAANNYDAAQQVAAGYLMAELPFTPQLRAIVGARAEYATIQLRTLDDGTNFTTGSTLATYPNLDGEQNILENLDILPSLNLNYDLSEATKLRFAYTRTLARPTFRELAPFLSFDVDGGAQFIGEPNLQRTLVDNVDLRWETYPKPGEIISVSAFYKNFNNPIERTFNPAAQNIEFTWRNVESAFLMGAELEFRKNLEVLTPSLKDFDLGLNFAYIYSRTDIDATEMLVIQDLDPDADDFRPMFGQAPYVFNALLSYNNDFGTQANLSFNIVGDRISLVTVGATPEYFQRPVPMLNFNIAQRINDSFKLRLALGNLLDANYRETVLFKDQEYDIVNSPIGINFSLGVSYSLR